MHPTLTFPYLHVYIHEGNPAALETRWQGYAPSADFRTAIEQAIELGRQRNIGGWLADDRLLGAVRPRDLQWVLETVMPAIAALGVTRFAQLEADDSLNRRTIAGMYGQATPTVPFEIRQFEDPVAARAWVTGLGM